MEIRANADADCVDKLSRRIITQSGGQFPVAGIVEDILPDRTPDRIYEVYPFRDGLTVSVHEVRNQSTSQPTDEQITEAFVGQVKGGSGEYARLQGTTRAQYKANGGTVDVGDSDHRKPSWVDVSRELFKAAWSSDRNELLIAWARSICADTLL
jgi:endoglucanase